MKSSGFAWTTLQLTLLLPLFMGAIELLLRVSLNRAGEEEFFPISLVAAGISLNVAVTALSGSTREDDARQRWMARHEQAIFIAKLGIFASLGGVLLWLYMLVASLSEEVQALVPFHPYREAAFYYIFSSVVTVWKSSVSRY
jgi:hypothetical protein